MTDFPVPIPPPNPLFNQNALRPPMRVTANPQLALGPGAGGAVATLDDLARQLVGGNPAAIPGATGAGAAGMSASMAGAVPRITDFPTAALGAPGPTGPVPPPINQLMSQLSGGGTGGASGGVGTPVNIAGGVRSKVAGAAASGVDDILGAAGAGGAAGIMGKLGKLPFPAGKFGRAGAGLGIGVVGNLLSGATGGNESMLGRFFSGAGMGGGLGAIGGPQSAVIGGLIGGLGNALMGGGEAGESADDRFANVLGQTSFDDETRSEFQVMYEILKETTGDDQAALSQVGQAMIQRMMEQDNAQAAQAKMLATQALTAQFFQPFTKQLLDSAQQRATIGENLAESLPENYRGIARMQNAASLDNATRTANAYAAQSQLLPAMAAIQYQQGLAQQAAQQAAAQGMNGGGATSLADLANQLAPTG